MVPVDITWVISCSISIYHTIVSVTIFKIFDVKFSWPWNRRVQGHPGSKFAVLIISFECNIVSLTVFEIFDIKVIFLLWQRWQLITLPVCRTWKFRISTKTTIDHSSWDSTLDTSLVTIDGKLRLVERSTRLCDRLADWLNWHRDEVTL